MSAELNKARSKLNGVKTLLKQEKLLAAVMSLREAVNIYLRTQLLKHEKQDFQRKLEEAVFQLGSDVNLKQQYPLQIEYAPGKEKSLQQQLKEIESELQESTVSQAKEQLSLMEQRREEMMQEGRGQLDRKELDEADKTFRKLTREFPDDPELKIEIGDLYLERNHTNEALGYYKAAHRDDPESVNTFNKLGMALRKSQQYDMAEKAYFEALKRAPEDEYLFFNLGRVYIDWQKWEKAGKASEKALKVNPDFKEASKMLSYARKMQTSPSRHEG
jgi:predicted Zn-dependent protease